MWKLNVEVELLGSNSLRRCSRLSQIFIDPLHGECGAWIVLWRVALADCKEEALGVAP